MRDLTKKQKYLINGWLETINYNTKTHNPADEMPDDLYNELEMINNTEILYYNINNYVNDRIMDRMKV